MKRLIVLIGFCYIQLVNAVIMPSPPPELSETLTEFRTHEQLQEEQMHEEGQQTQSYNMDSAPFVPGDESVGVMRLSSVYVQGQAIGVPFDGIAIVRFYDLNGTPWEIERIALERQGFNAQTTASPSELLIKQATGATNTQLKVNLVGLSYPLLMILHPVDLLQQGIRVNTVLQTLQIRALSNVTDYVPPQLTAVPVPIPHSTNIEYEPQSQEHIEQLLIEAAREIKVRNYEDNVEMAP